MFRSLYKFIYPDIVLHSSARMYRSWQLVFLRDYLTLVGNASLRRSIGIDLLIHLISLLMNGFAGPTLGFSNDGSSGDSGGEVDADFLFLMSSKIVL